MPCTLHQPPIARRVRSGGAFSLVELSVVIVIISVVAVMGLEVAATYMSRTAYQITVERVTKIDQAIAAFVKLKGRLPCPASRTGVPAQVSYGKEVRGGANGACSSASMNAGSTGTIMLGDVPARDLNLPLSYMVDGYGSKIRLLVTRDMGKSSVDDAASNFFTVNDAIVIRSGNLDSTCGSAGNLCQNRGTAAYAVLSHGKDKRGGVSRNATITESCSSAPATAYDSMIDTVNCRLNGSHATYTLVKSGNGSTVTIPPEVLYDSRYNAGTQEANHFDDIIVWRSKADL